MQEKSVAVLSLLLSLLTLSSLLAIGTVHVTTLLILAPFALLAGAFALFVEDEATISQRLPAIIAALLSAYSLAQSVPLPPKLLATLSPNALQIWTDAFRLAGETSGQWASLSLDPGASRVEALKWLCYAAIYLAAARLAKDRGSKPGVMIVVGAALVGGTLSVVHGLFGIEAWFGLYKPRYAHPPWALSPILNPNSFAGYLNLALFSGFGLLFVRKPPLQRWVLALGIAMLAALVVLSASRGGVAAAVLGFAIAGVAFARQQRRARLRGGFVFPTWLPLTAVAVAASTLVALGATDTVWRDLLNEALDKLTIFERSRPMVADYFWTGVGRGAFETVFPAYRTYPGHTVAQFAENFVAQWIVEWGLPVACIGMLSLLWAFRPDRSGFARNAVPTGIHVAIGVFLLQNLVDLGTELASVGFAAALLLGTITGGVEYFHNKSRALLEARQKRQGRAVVQVSRSSFAGVLPTATMLIAGGGLAFLVATTGQPDALEERWRLAEQLQDIVGKPRNGPGADALQRSIERAMLRHPADPYVPLIGSMLAPRTNKTQFAWLNQALRRDPMSAPPHLMLADVLVERGATNQALAELRRTAELEPGLTTEIATRIAKWANSVPDIMRAVPEGRAGIGVLNAVAMQLHATPTDQATHGELLRISLERDRNSPATNGILAMELLAALATSAPECSGERRPDCETRLHRHANVVIANTADVQQSLMMKARLLGYGKNEADAERLLAERCPHVPDPVSCQALRVTNALALKEAAHFEEAANAYVAVACSTPTACSRAGAWVGALEAQRGNLPAALARYERSAQEEPSAEAWLRVVDVALQLHRVTRAQSALMAARRLATAQTQATIEQKSDQLQHARLLQELDATGRSR